MHDNRGIPGEQTHNNKETMETVFSVPSILRLYKEVSWTSSLQVIGSDEKGSLKSERVKYGHKTQGTRTQERLRWRGPAAYIKDRPVLSSERAPHKNKTVTVKQ
jgi:hypothetical protein